MRAESRREFVFMRWPKKMTFEQSPKGSGEGSYVKIRGRSLVGIGNSCAKGKQRHPHSVEHLHVSPGHRGFATM